MGFEPTIFGTTTRRIRPAMLQAPQTRLIHPGNYVPRNDNYDTTRSNLKQYYCFCPYLYDALPESFCLGCGIYRMFVARPFSLGYFCTKLSQLSNLGGSCLNITQNSSILSGMICYKNNNRFLNALDPPVRDTSHACMCGKHVSCQCASLYIGILWSKISPTLAQCDWASHNTY